MKKLFLHWVEKKCVFKLLKFGFASSGKINYCTKQIIFNPFGLAIFKTFITPKEQFYITILIKWCKYKVYEQNLILFCQERQQIKSFAIPDRHTGAYGIHIKGVENKKSV